MLPASMAGKWRDTAETQEELGSYFSSILHPFSFLILPRVFPMLQKDGGVLEANTVAG